LILRDKGVASIKVECSNCHKVYQIPKERFPTAEVFSFPCPGCKEMIKLDRRARDGAPQGSSSVSSREAGGLAMEGEPLKAKILMRVKELPPMPQTVFKAREILGDPKSSAQQVAMILETDQAIAAKVLKMANSAYYGLMGKVSSIQHASVVLGYKTLAEIVTLAGGSAVLGSTLEGYDLAAGDLWNHSLGVAFGSKIIATRKHPALANDAFAAGLIHDVGKLVLDPYVRERKEAFQAFMAGEQRPFLLAEREILGFDHGEIAFELCRAWNVPQTLLNAIRHHHAPDKGNGNDLTAMVHMADVIAMMSGIGVGMDGLLYEMDNGSMQALGLQEADITSLMMELVESVRNVATEMTGH
jgi:HD-like signal output (HDOD) protein